VFVEQASNFGQSAPDVWRPDSARITSCMADPPKARSIRSSTSWRWVAASLKLAL
jgi:hypothetical protein